MIAAVVGADGGKSTPLSGRGSSLTVLAPYWRQNDRSMTLAPFTMIVCPRSWRQNDRAFVGRAKLGRFAAWHARHVMP
jgi:hypothetical protein